jgi:hypothetical protein
MEKNLIALIALSFVTACGSDNSDGDDNSQIVTSAIHDCAKVPYASVNASDGTFTFTSTCEKIAVNGGNNKVRIEATKTVRINGEKNVVEINAADKISIDGSGNTIIYRKGLTAKTPNLVSTGDNNSVTQLSDATKP